MSEAANTAPARLRALVVEPDQTIRQELTAVLEEYGLEVITCTDMARGRELFSDHRLVVAPLNGDNLMMKQFVSWLRAEAGSSQPWIIGVGAGPQLAPHETPSHYGVNDFLTSPLDRRLLVARLEELGISRIVAPMVPKKGTPIIRVKVPSPPSYSRARQSNPALAAWDLAASPVLLEHFPAGVAVLDRNMKYLAVNARWVREFQIPTATLTGRSHYEIFPDLHDDWRSLYELGLAGKGKQSIDDVISRPDGTASKVNWEIQPWHDGSGAVGGLILTCRTLETPPPLLPEVAVPPRPATGPEVPLEKPSVPNLVDLSFREMAEAAPFGMILLDEDAHVIYFNPQHRAVLGFAAECGAPLQNWLERACAGDEVFQKRALSEWWECVWRRRTPLTCSLRNSEGLVKDIEFRPAALSGDRLLLTVFDVTDARLDEQAIRASEARYRGLFQQASAALVMINPAGNITEVNPAFETLTGLARHEARRATLTDFLAPDMVTRLRAATVAGGQSEGFPAILRHRNGTEQATHLSVAVIRNEQGQPAFTVCLFAPQNSSSPVPAPTAPWDQITPDWLFLLDASGTILKHSTSRDFSTFADGDFNTLTGQLLESAQPELTAPLPLDVMMERLLDHPGQETRCEYTLQRENEKSARRIEARLILFPGDGEPQYGLIMRDLTRSRTASSPGGFSVTLLEHLHTPALLTNDRGRILHLNPAAEALSGYASAELHEGGLFRLFRPEAPREFGEELSRQLQTHGSWNAGVTLTHKDGTKSAGTAELTPAYDETAGARGFVLLFRPEQAAAPSPAADPRPAVSLHRARNDFQILTSMLALQADQTEDPASRRALLAGRDRLSAIALIYRLIKHEDDLIDFARFTAEIGRTLLEAHRRPAGKITIEPLFSGVSLPQRLSIGLGLIVEELITSSLAWSFPEEDDTGHIRITLTNSDGHGILIFRDNGSLLSATHRAKRKLTFSYRLQQLLAQQITGTLSYAPDLENQVTLQFPWPEPGRKP